MIAHFHCQHRNSTLLFTHRLHRWVVLLCSSRPRHTALVQTFLTSGLRRMSFEKTGCSVSSSAPIRPIKDNLYPPPTDPLTPTISRHHQPEKRNKFHYHSITSVEHDCSILTSVLSIFSEKGSVVTGELNGEGANSALLIAKITES